MLSVSQKKVFSDELAAMIRDNRTFPAAFHVLADKHQVPGDERKALAQEMGRTLGKRPKKKPKTSTSLFVFESEIKNGTLHVTEQFSGIVFMFRKNHKHEAVMTSFMGQATPSMRMREHAQAHAQEVARNQKPKTRVDTYKCMRIVVGTSIVRIKDGDSRAIILATQGWEFTYCASPRGASRTTDAYVGKTQAKDVKKPSPKFLADLRRIAVHLLKDPYTLELFK